MKKFKTKAMDPVTQTFKDVENWIYAICHRYRKNIPFDEALSIAMVSYMRAYEIFDHTRSTFRGHVKTCIVGDFCNHRRKERKEAKKKERALQQKQRERSRRRLQIDQFMLEASQDASRLMAMIIRPKTESERRVMEAVKIYENVDAGKLLLRMNHVLKWDYDRLYKAYVEVREFVHEG